MEQVLEVVLLIIAVAFVGLFVQGFISLVVTLAGKPNCKKEIRAHYLIFIIGTVISLIFAGLLLLIIEQNIDADIYNKFGYVIMLSPLISIGLVLVMVYVNYQIKYDDTGFTYRNLFRLKRRYNYSDIWGIIENDVSFKLVVKDKKRLMIHGFSIGVRPFIETIEQWRKANGIQPKQLPTKREPLFNDNIANADNYIATWIILVVGMGALFLSAVFMSLPIIDNNDLVGLLFSGAIWLLFIIAGLIFRFFMRNAQKYPRILKSLIGATNIKNLVARKKLGLKPSKNPKK